MLGYCLKHPLELEAYLGDAQLQNSQARQQDEERYPPDGLKHAFFKANLSAVQLRKQTHL